MEIRANYVLVGLSTIVVGVLCLAFLLWMGGRNSSQRTALYDVNFPTAVSGIGIGTDVQFLGIKVGSIKDLWIDPKTLSSVRVRIEVADATPIRSDTTATIVLRGITGGSVLLLHNPSNTAPLLHPNEHEIPEIHASASPLEKITNDIPTLLTSANQLLTSLHGALSKENIKKIGEILNSLGSFSARMAERGGDIEEVIDNLNTTMSRIANAVGKVETLADGLNAYVHTDLHQTTRSISETAKRIDTFVADITPGLSRFTGDGLDEFQRLLAELRQLVTTFDHLARRIEGDPRHFLFGSPVPEYTP